MQYFLLSMQRFLFLSSLWALSSLFASACIDFSVIGQIMVGGDDHDVPEVGLVGHWALDEGGGQVALDESANKNDGNVVGSADGWRPSAGRYNGALELSGGRHVEIASAAMSSGKMTIAVWIQQPVAPTADQAIVSKGTAAWGLFRTVAPGEIEFRGCNGAWNISGIGLADGKWHHVAAVYNGLRVLLYADGVLKNSFVPSGPLGSNASPILLGKDPANAASPFVGFLDDVLLYNRALSDEEIRSTVLAGNPGSVDSVKPVLDVQRLKLRGRVGSSPGQVTIQIQGNPVNIAADGTFEIELPVSEFEKGVIMESRTAANVVTQTKIKVDRS